MKESFNELYTRLYNENFSDLEARRKELNKETVIFLIGLVITFALTFINLLFVYVFLVFTIVLVIISVKKVKKDETNGKLSYASQFKVKIVRPLLDNMFDEVRYEINGGFTSLEYKSMRI